MSNVTALKRQPDPDVIDRLELILKRAKSGQITAFVALCDGITDDGSPATEGHSAGTFDTPSMLFAFECWKQRVIREANVEPIW